MSHGDLRPEAMGGAAAAVPFVLAGLVAFLLLKGGRNGGRPSAPRLDARVRSYGWSSDDVQYLARVLVMEAARLPDSLEWAGIGFVAANRAMSRNTTIRRVVATTRWSGGGERGDAFVARIQSDYPTRQRTWPQALAWAERLLAGEIPNPIGRREHFVHPRGMPRCGGRHGACEGNRMCIAGRCRPPWSVAKADGGSAQYDPVEVDRAVFAGPPTSSAVDVPGVVAANASGVWFTEAAPTRAGEPAPPEWDVVEVDVVEEVAGAGWSRRTGDVAASSSTPNVPGGVPHEWEVDYG